VWLNDDVIAFTRLDDKERPAVWRISAGGGEPRRAHPAARRTRARLAPTGELVLLSHQDANIGGERIFLWDPATGRERQLRVPVLDRAYLLAVRAAPDGSFLAVCSGTMGQDVWRVPLAAPETAKKVFSLSQGQTMSGIAVSEDGRILVAPDEWLP
jgi:Tol biopolymer transport system component